jgi:CheY-like chemotaxis protein
MVSILVADDRAGIRLLLRRMLEPPHQVIEAADGDDALRKLQQFWPAIAVLDVDMPGLTGLELCQRIRADARLASIGVILMTAKGTEDQASARAAGADEFLAKPFSPGHVSALVDGLLSTGATRR